MCATCERSGMSGRAADPWVRRFSVDETRRHPGGFTVYKITSVLFQLAAPEAATVVCVWKRYSDISALHTSMVALHSALHLAGKPPQLPRTAYFTRFDSAVISERATATKHLLEFVAEHGLLFTSGEFVTFMKSGYECPSGTEASVLGCGPVESRHGTAQVQALDCPEHDAPVLTPVKLTPTSPQQPPSLPADSTPDSPATMLEPSLLRTLEAPGSTSVSLSSWGSASSLFDELDAASPRHMSREQLHVSNDKPRTAQNLPDLISFQNTTDCATVEETTPSRPVMSESYVLRDYTSASYLLERATQRQRQGDLLEAFHCYRAGIEHMLHGVQKDTDVQRRRAIKEKTSEYLAYAENIYRDHLAAGNNQGISLQLEDAETHSATECLEELDPSDPVAAEEHPALRRAHSELGRYRVLAVGPQGQICLVHVPTQACRSLQVVRKIPSCDGAGGTVRTLLPTNVPYMARLHCYVETPDMLYLITDHAPGGRLAEYIACYDPDESLRRPDESLRRPDESLRRPDESLRRPDESHRSLNESLRRPVGVVEATEREVNEGDADVRWKRSEEEELSVDDIVVSSQRLLLDVDSALSDVPAPEVRAGREMRLGARAGETEDVRAVRALPAGTVRQWGAELLTAIEHLHMAGVVCRELSIDNLLLGEAGQLLVEYTACYPTSDVTLVRVSLASLGGARPAHVAPELQGGTAEGGAVADWWSYGAVMYELICREPLSSRHLTAFTSHTLLQFPPNVPLEAESLLTQLLTYDPARRLGANGALEVKGHLYFRGVDWERVRRSWRPPPD